MGHFCDLMAIYCVTHSGTMSHTKCPLVTGPLDYGDPKGTGGIHRQTCHAAFAHNATYHYKMASVIYSANLDGSCLKVSRYLPLAQFGFEFGFTFLFPLS